MRRFDEYPHPEDLYLHEHELYMKYKHLPEPERSYLMNRVKGIRLDLKVKKQKQYEKELEEKIAKAAEEQIGKAFDEVSKDLFK